MRREGMSAASETNNLCMVMTDHMDNRQTLIKSVDG